MEFRSLLLRSQVQSKAAVDDKHCWWQKGSRGRKRRGVCLRYYRNNLVPGKPAHQEVRE
jgi:hypothetical protein